MQETLGERIRTARLGYGMSQTELAKRVGISKTAMNQIEMGDTTDPRLSRIRAIADILGVSMDYLAGRTDANTISPSPTRQRPRKIAPVA